MLNPQYLALVVNTYELNIKNKIRRFLGHYQKPEADVKNRISTTTPARYLSKKNSTVSLKAA